MRGEDLHGALHHIDLTRFEAAFLLLGRRQESEEAGQRATVGLGGVAGRGVAERVQVTAGQTGVAGMPAPHGDLHVQAGRPLDVGDQVRQGLVQALPQRAQFPAVRP